MRTTLEAMQRQNAPFSGQPPYECGQIHSLPGGGRGLIQYLTQAHLSLASSADRLAEKQQVTSPWTGWLASNFGGQFGDEFETQHPKAQPVPVNRTPNFALRVRTIKVVIGFRGHGSRCRGKVLGRVTGLEGRPGRESPPSLTLKN